MCTSALAVKDKAKRSANVHSARVYAPNATNRPEVNDFSLTSNSPLGRRKKHVRALRLHLPLTLRRRDRHTWRNRAPPPRGSWQSLRPQRFSYYYQSPAPENPTNSITMMGGVTFGVTPCDHSLLPFHNYGKGCYVWCNTL